VLFVKKDLLGEIKKRITSALLGSTLNGQMSRKQLPVHGSTRSEREQLSSGKLLAAKLIIGHLQAGRERSGRTQKLAKWFVFIHFICRNDFYMSRISSGNGSCLRLEICPHFRGCGGMGFC